MDSQNSLETVILTVTVFTGNRWKSVSFLCWGVVQEISDVWLSLSSPHSQDTLLSWHRYVKKHMEWCQQGNSSRPQCPEILLGIHYIGTMDGFTARVLVWPRITLDNIAGFFSVASPILRLSGFSQFPLCTIVLDYLVKIKTLFSAL